MSDTTPVTLSVQGMACASFVGRVEAALTALDGVEGVGVNLAAETARFDAAGPESVADAARALDDLGYPACRADAVLSVGAMSCAACAGRVERALAAIPGVLEVAVNPAAQTAHVTCPAGATDPGALAGAATRAGCPATPAERSARIDRAERKAGEARQAARRTALAALLTAPAFALEMGGAMVPALGAWIAGTIGTHVSRAIQLVLTTLLRAGPGWQFFWTGLPALAGARRT